VKEEIHLSVRLRIATRLSQQHKYGGCSAQGIDVNFLEIKFTENLPNRFFGKMYKTFIKLWVVNYHKRRLIGLLPWVGSYSKELIRLEEEEGAVLPFYDQKPPDKTVDNE